MSIFKVAASTSSDDPASLTSQSTLAEGMEPPRRRRHLTRKAELARNAVLHLALFALIMGLWQLTSQTLVKPLWISSPSRVWNRLVDLVETGVLWSNTWATLKEALLGLVIGTVAGLVVGLLLHRFQFVSKLVWPYLMTGYAMPRIALAPFFVMWFGIGLESKVLLVVSVVFFVVLFNVRQGLDTVDPDHLDVMTSMRASRFATMRYVQIPTVVPWLVAGVKIAVGQALVSAVVAEMVGSTQGLGWFVVNSLNRFDMSGAITALIILVILARGLYYLLAIAETQLFKWRRASGTVDVP